MKRIVRPIPSLLLGFSFLLSGALKGIDPYGTSLKLSEYFRVWGWGGFVAEHPLAWSVCLCAGELWLGLLLLSGAFRRLSAWLAVLAMTGFTAVSAWLLFSPAGVAVTDCGCFGEAFTLSHGATLGKNAVLLALAVGCVLMARGASWLPSGLCGKWTALCCAAFSAAIPSYSVLRLPPADFLPYNRGADLATADGLVLFDHRYEEVTDSLLRLSAERPLVAVVAREGLTAAGLSKLEHFRRQSARRQLRLCLWTLPGREAGSGLESYYADVMTLKSLVRADAGFLVVEDGMVRAKRNLLAFRPERFGRPVTVPQLVEEDAGLPYRHAGCVAAGLLLIAAVRRHEKSVARRVADGRTGGETGE